MSNIKKYKETYTCPICKEPTKADEWADDDSCINCGPVNTDCTEKNTYFLIDNHIK